MNKNRYEAQALAIAMIVLVVSSIIGMSIYSRVSKDKSLAIKEQASAEALEISDLLLDYLIQVPISSVIAAIDDTDGDIPSEGVSMTESISDTEITTFLNGLLGSENVSLDDLGLCSLDTSGNEYSLKIQETDEDSFYEIRPGQVRSFLIGDLNLPVGCEVDLSFSIRGESNAGFSITKIYKRGLDIYKEYEFTDTTSYCFSLDNGNSCSGDNFGTDNWEKYIEGNPISPTLSEHYDYDGETYILDEVRIKAIGGTVGIAYSLSDECTTQGLRLISIQAGANCNGVYRGKEILVPENKWSSPIFDYVIFNGEGSI